jgi:AcrR family transcriptional regulator
VRAAMRLADADGLEAVSLRKVATALGVGPMRLYSYIDSKEELLDLMVDAVHAEIRPAGDSWREMLRSLAEATRHAAHEHEWLADLLGGRPQLGPHALANGETVVAALGDVAVDAVMPVVGAVNAYVIGAVRREIAARRAERWPPWCTTPPTSTPTTPSGSAWTSCSTASKPASQGEARPRTA